MGGLPNKKWNVTHFSFLDDIFLATDKRSKKRALDFADQIKSKLPGIKFSIECRADAVDFEIFKSLKSAGLERAFVGLESGNQADLSAYNKRTDLSTNREAIEILSKLDVIAAFGFIMFNPDSTIDRIRENINFLSSLQLCYPSALCSTLSAYQGTPAWSKLKLEGRILGTPLMPTYNFRDSEVEMARNIFRRVFVDRSRIDTLRRKAEFALALSPSSLSVAIKQKFKLACIDLSTVTASAASKLISSIGEITDQQYNDLVSAISAGMAQIATSFEEIINEGTKFHEHLNKITS